MATMLGAVAANPMVRQVGKQIIGGVADKATQGILGGIGGAIGGKKGKKVGKTIAKGLGKIRKGIFGFNDGGKVRAVPMRVRGYNAGGMIVEPAVIRPLPRPRRRRMK